MKKAEAFLIVFFVTIALLEAFPILVHGQPFYELWILAHEGGTTNPPSGSSILVGTVVPPTGITVRAMPNVGWSFDHWELNRTNMGGGVMVGRDSLFTVTMDNSYLLEAFFRANATVGGFTIPEENISIDKPNLLAPYIGLVSTILVATVATSIYTKHVKRRKEKQ